MGYGVYDARLARLSSIAAPKYSIFPLSFLHLGLKIFHFLLFHFLVPFLFPSSASIRQNPDPSPNLPFSFYFLASILLSELVPTPACLRFKKLGQRCLKSGYVQSDLVTPGRNMQTVAYWQRPRATRRT